MNARRVLLTVVVVAALANAAGAVDLPIAQKRPKFADIASILAGTSTDALAGSLRGYLANNVTPTLYESYRGWGHTKEVVRGLKWSGQGLNVHPEVLRSPKNDGTWKHIRVTADNLPNTLILDIRNVQWAEPGRTTFDVFLAFDARLDYEEQKWDDGKRIFGMDIRARFRAKVMLSCELTTKLETSSIILPDAVFRLRVVQSNLQYDNVVVEHAAGLGGELAKLMGDAALGVLHRWHPSLEHDLCERANQAIVKAGDTKEVHVGLARLLMGKK